MPEPDLTEIFVGQIWESDLCVCYDALPMRNILVPQVGHTPWVAGRPFFMVIDWVSFISRCDRHLTQ